MGQDISLQDRVTFHELCTVCRRVCGQSRILNDQNYFHHLADQWIKIEEGDSRFPLRQSFPDPSQWNDSRLHIFEEETPHHLSGAALEASAVAGCHLCNLFWNYVSLERFGILKEEEDLETKQLAEASRSKAREQLLVTSEPLFVRVGIEQNYDPAEDLIINVGVTGSEHNAAIVLYAGRHDHLPELRSTLNVWPTKVVQGITRAPLTNEHAVQKSISTASNVTMKHAKKWLRACRNEQKWGEGHYHCRRSVSWDPPLRVLDLRPTQPRLLVISRRQTNFRYVCLSHCWGGADIFKLTKGTLAQLQNGVPLNLLLQTFQDAINITRRLGYRYLWIDSLCIFQDDDDDWKKQAAKMGCIYLNSDLTIGAMGSSDSHGGCYSSRNPLSYWPCVLPTGAGLTAWYGRVWPFHNESFRNAPLLQRGWVQQERCLGTRTLYFGKFGIKWECHSRLNDEFFLKDLVSPFGREESTDMIAAKTIFDHLYHSAENCLAVERIKRTKESPCQPVILLSFLTYWHRIVELYTRSQLTFSNDKLMAIAGLVDVVQQRTGLTSLAGLWREVLLEDLLWASVSPKDAIRPSDYRAPSFSWASIDGVCRRRLDRLCDPINSGYISPLNGEPHTGDREYLATLVSEHTVMEDSSRHTGKVLRASIQLRGHVARTSVSIIERYQGNPRYWTHPYIASEDGESKWGHRWLAIDTVSDCPSDTLDVLCVPIVQWTHHYNSDGGYLRHVAGLVLVPSAERLNEYQRVGMFEDCWMTKQERWVNERQETLEII